MPVVSVLLVFEEVEDGEHQQEAVDSAGGEKNGRTDLKRRQFITQTVEVMVLLVVVVTAAVEAQGLNIVFGLTGSTVVVGIIYVFPCIFFLQLRKQGKLRSNSKSNNSSDNSGGSKSGGRQLKRSNSADGLSNSDGESHMHDL